MKELINSVNCLGKFLGKRDIESLSKEELQNKYGVEKADVFVLFGGSILCGADVLAQAIQNNIADTYIIVGGAGHTTENLRNRIHSECPDIITADLEEAVILNEYIKKKYEVEADYLETKSTNCGNNITYLMDLIKENDIKAEHIIICQDATMQYRMEAVLRKYVDDGVTIINYAAYQADLILKDDQLSFLEEIHGMWDVDRYINLLMGEIPRLRDDENGYGPRGSDYLVHVDIPEEVKISFDILQNKYNISTRIANPKFKS